MLRAIDRHMVVRLWFRADSTPYLAEELGTQLPVPSLGISTA
jgi:hypothetical protein